MCFLIEILNYMLQMGSTTHKTEMTIIAGVLKGLAGYLVHFTQSVAEGVYPLYCDVSP